MRECTRKICYTTFSLQKVAEKRIFFFENLHSSKKSSTFASSKLKYQRQPDELPQACGIFYALRLYVNGFSIGYPVHLAVMAVQAFDIGLRQRVVSDIFLSKTISIMCKISKSVDVHAIKEHLQTIVNGIHETEEKINATLVEDETYMTMTAIIGDQVLCINFMSSGKEGTL